MFFVTEKYQHSWDHLQRVVILSILKKITSQALKKLGMLLQCTKKKSNNKWTTNNDKYILCISCKYNLRKHFDKILHCSKK